MGLISYISDKVGQRGLNGIVHGSDGRFNVSARADSRGYYNSRDENKSYSLVFDDAACSAGDFNAVMFNNSDDKLILQKVTVNALAVAGFKLHRVTVAAAGGAVSATPINLHLGEADAEVTASTVVNSDSSPISGTITSSVLDHISVVASGHGIMGEGDQIRVAKGDGIAVEMDSGANATRVFGAFKFYFESD